MGVLETLGINPQVILANVISFLILYAILAKFAFKPLGDVMRQRKDEIEESYNKIADENAKAQRMQADLAKRLDEIEAEARSKIQEAAAQASKLKDEILAEARAQADQVRQRGLQDIERERDKALQSIREQVADLVIQAGEKVLGQSMSDAKHREMIAKTINELESIRN